MMSSKDNPFVGGGTPSRRDLIDYFTRLRDEARSQLVTADLIDNVRNLQGRVQAYERVLRDLQ